MEKMLNHKISILLTIVLAVMIQIGCKSDQKKEPTPTIEDDVTSLNVKVDSTQVDYSRMTNFHFVSLPHFYRWNSIGQTLIPLTQLPLGYSIIDTLSWVHPSGKNFMTMSLAETTGESADFKQYYEVLKSRFPYKEYNYTKYNVGRSEMYEYELSGDSLNTYKLIIPRGKRFIQLDVLSRSADFNDEVAETLDQLPGLVNIKAH